MDQSLFAAPHGFSQRTTSFFASRRQGIHQMPLRRLTRMPIPNPRNGKGRPANRQQKHAPANHARHTGPNPRLQNQEPHRPARTTRAANITLFTMSKNQTPAEQRQGPIKTNVPHKPIKSPEDPTSEAQSAKDGGADRDRTDDLLLAKQALSQLSYGPRSRE